MLCNIIPHAYGKHKEAVLFPCRGDWLIFFSEFTVDCLYLSLLIFF